MHQDTDYAWDGVDRRKSPPLPEDNREFWQHVMQQFESVSAKLSALHIDMVGNKADMHVLKADVEDLKKAFPKNSEGARDIDGHRGFHETMDESARSWKEIWIDVRKKVFSGIAWVTLCFIAYSIWEAIKAEAKK